MSELTTQAPADAHEEEIRRKIEELCAEKRRSAASYRRYADQYEAEIPEVEGKVRTFFAVKAALEAAGFKPDAGLWSLTLSVKGVGERDLVALARVLGPMPEESRGAEPREKDGKQVRPTHARVTLRPTRYPFVEVSRLVKLGKAVKCRVVTRIEKRRELVCEV
jgi:hypothetical protein